MCVGNKLRRITAMIMIIVMVVTSGGIHSFSSTFANAINEMKEDSKDLSHKYYDEMMEEKEEGSHSSPVLENGEDSLEGENEEGSLVGEDEGGSQNSDTSRRELRERQEGEGDSQSSETSRRDLRERQEGEEPEEDENTKESDEEPEEDETKEAAADDTSEDGSSAEESESTEESETEGETTPAFDEENNIASDSEADTDAINDEEDNASNTEEEHIKTATYSEMFTVATGSDAEEVDDEMGKNIASLSELDEIDIASYSDLFTVATDSLLKKFAEATSSDLSDNLGGWDHSHFSKGNVPALVVWGDIGYYPGGHVGKGILGMYLGKKDNGGDEWQGKWSGGNESNGNYYETNGINFYGVQNVEMFNGKKWHENDWSFMKFPDNESDVSDCPRAYKVAPQYNEVVSWYIKASGNFQRALDYFENGGNWKYMNSIWSKNNIPAFVWSDRIGAKPRNQCVVPKYTADRDKVLGWMGGNYNAQYNYNNKSYLNERQNILGYIVTKDYGNGNYDLQLVDHVKFDNNWQTTEATADTWWHIADMDDHITIHSSDPKPEQYDWHLHFTTAYYGIFSNWLAENKVGTKIDWENNGWDGSARSCYLYAEPGNDNAYSITVPSADKKVRWENGGKVYKLIGWVPAWQDTYQSRKSKWKDDDTTKRLVKGFGRSQKTNLYNQGIYWPGTTVDYKLTGTWPVTFGPIYRDAMDSMGNPYPDWHQEGNGFGLADKGLLYVDWHDSWWNTITKVRRTGSDSRNDISNIQYNAIFFSPVLKEVENKTCNFHTNGGKWSDGTTNAKTKSYSNFDDLPGSSFPAEPTRYGYKFDGWYTNATNGNRKTSLSKNDTIYNLYAHWTPNKYTIQIYNTTTIATTSEVDENGKLITFEIGENKLVREYKDFSYTGKINLPNGKNIASTKDNAGGQSKVGDNYDFTKEGFKLIGWSQTKNSKTVSWSLGKEGVEVSSLTLPDDTTKTVYIYPVFEELTTKIRFIGGNAKGSDGETYSSGYDEEVELNYWGGFNLPKPDFKGFNIEGWRPKGADVIIPAGDPKLKFSEYESYFSYTNTVEYEAVWKEKEYTIEFIGGWKTASDKASYSSIGENRVITTKYFTKVETPDHFSMTDFTLVGFGKVNDGDSDTIVIPKNADFKIGERESLLSDTNINILYGVWKEKEINVVFDGVTKIGSDGKPKNNTDNKVEKVYKYKSKVDIPQDFTLEGFHFKGFSTEDGSDTVTLEATEEKTLTELITTYCTKDENDEFIFKNGNFVFYAVWAEKKFNLKIEAGSKVYNGKTYVGQGSIDANMYGYYSSVLMPKNMTLNGFKLIGFNKEDNQDNKTYEPDQNVSIKDLINYLSMKEYTDDNEDPYTLYGVWEMTSATLILKAENGYFSNGTRELILNPNETGKALGNYDGYEEPKVLYAWEFSHWEDDDKNKYTKDSEVVGSITLYAKYIVKHEEVINNTVYTVQIINDSNKGRYTGPTSFGVRLGSYILASMSEAGVTEPVAKVGYTFAGWSFDGENIISDKTQYTDITEDTLQAVYKENTIEIVLSAETGKFKNGAKAINIVSTKSMALNEYEKYEEPTKDGHIFKRWVDGFVEVASTSIITSDIRLVANYAKESSPSDILPVDTSSYTINVENDSTKGTYTGNSSFELTFGSNILASMSELGIVNPVANEGWTFLGWSWTGESDKLVKDTDTYIDTGLNTIKAVYSQDTYTVVLSTDEGEFVGGRKTKTLVSNAKVTLGSFAGYEEPTRDGYVFTRWLDAYGVEVATKSIITKDTALLAVFKKKGADITEKRYTIEILNNDEKGVVKVGGKVSTVPVRFKIGIGEDILDTIATYSITVEPKPDYWFKGWSWTGSVTDLIKEGDKYTEYKNVHLIPVYINKNEFTVVLDANTGVFKLAGGRTLELTTNNLTVKALKNLDKYERPEKANATFKKWETAAKIEFLEDTLINDSSVPEGLIVLTAIYNDNEGNEIGGDKDTQDGGKDATYTLTLKSEKSKGTMSNVEKSTIIVNEVEYEVTLVEVKPGDKILEKIDEKGLTIETDEERFFFEGWSTTNDLNNLINDETIYDDKNLTEIRAAYLKALHIEVKLNANTGVFRNNMQRTKTMNSKRKIMLQNFVNYEEPVKSDGFKFDHWEDASKTTYDLKYEFGEEYDFNPIELFAIYKDSNNNIIGRDDTSDGGDNAYYTVFNDYDPAKSSMSNASFEVKYMGLVKDAMKAYKAYEPYNEAIGWWLKGWTFDGLISHIVTNETLYDDVSQTVIYAGYIENDKWTVVLNANTGLFDDNTREKILQNDKKVKIGEFEFYEVPKKSDGYEFIRWEKLDGTEFKDTDFPDDPQDFTLYAVYQDKNGNIIDPNNTNNLDLTYTIRLSSDATKGTLGKVDTFELAKGSYILASMSEAGVTDPIAKNPYYFVGWAWDDGMYDYAITNENIYKGNEGTVLYALYSDEVFDVVLNANTGIFKDNTRTKTLQVPKYQLLIGNKDYEVPEKADSTFNWWLKNDNAISDLKTYKIEEAQTLDAAYNDPDNPGKVIGKDDTADGGENATYTIRIVNNDYFGSYTGAEKFEIKLGDVIYTTMKAAGVTEGEPKAGNLFKGWRHGSELISAITTYKDTNLTTLVLEYSNVTTELTLDASFGRFKDKSQIKRFNVARGRVINTIAEYEEPTKNNWTFSRWVDELGVTVASSSELPDDAQKVKLKAKYKNSEGIEVDEDSHKHLICGAVDEVGSHAIDIIASHDEKISYYPVSNAEEFMDYIDAELAKAATDRSDIKLYLEDDIKLDRNIELDGGIGLYICLNGHTLTSGKLGSKYKEYGNVYVTNCKEIEASVVEKATVSDLTKPLFGANNLYVLSAKGAINVAPSGMLVKIISTDSIATRNVELMNVKIEGNEDATVDSFIKAEGNVFVRLSDVSINKVNVSDVLLAAYDEAKLFMGENINITNNTTNRAIIDVRDKFEIVDNSVVNIADNIIEKNKNGDTAVMFIGGNSNYVGGLLAVKENKLDLSDNYKKLVKVEPVTEDNSEDENEFDSNLGVYLEEESPAGEVGYSAAVMFTKEEIGFDVGNAKIEIYGNESVASYSDVRAGYMYQLRAKANDYRPLIKQNIGTALDETSVIGVAFGSEDGEGLLTDSAKIGENTFVNNTFGKEEKLLKVKTDLTWKELRRKLYYVEYDEGEAITTETKKHIETFLANKTTISEATRVRSDAIKAGHNIQLKDKDIYYTKGFNMSTYSLISKRKEKLGNFDAKATVSYIDVLFGDGEDIEDGDIISAKSNWLENEFTSEASPLVLTKEIYDELVKDAVENAVIAKASVSDINQVEEYNEDNYYTIRYYLDGGQFDGIDMHGLEYYEETGVSRKEEHSLLGNVFKVATESGVRKQYDFEGWCVIEDYASASEIDYEYIARPVQADNGQYTIEANYEGERLLVVKAAYLPSTYTITYHLGEGRLEGVQGDTIVDTITRLSNYTLIKGVTRPDYVFTGWEDADTILYGETIKGGTLTGDIEAYAQYDSVLYTVTYDLRDGMIKGITNEGDQTYIDDKANRLVDYYLLQEVIKEGYKFKGWETANGVKVDVIPAGDTDESKRFVLATFDPVMWEINYDTDGGTIDGFSQGNVTDKVYEGTEYELYTNVTKPGFEFDYWYETTNNAKVDVIKDAVGGKKYSVKAKYIPLTYDLNLYIDGAASPIEIKGINNREDYIIPTYYEVADKEFVNWYYKDETGNPAIIDKIEAGNPNNIKDVYANYEDLLTRKITYHLGEGETIEGVTDYDADSTLEDKKVTIFANRRNDTVLYTDVKKESTDNKEYIFMGWLNGKTAPDSLDELTGIVRYVDGIAKEVEEKFANDPRNLPQLLNEEFDYYPYFAVAHAETVEIEYHSVNGGMLPGKELVDGKYQETVNVGAECSFRSYYSSAIKDSMCPGYTFVGVYGDEKCDGELIEAISKNELQEKADKGETIHLYVKFNKVRYNLEYHLNGGTMPGKKLIVDNSIYKTTFDNRSDVTLDTNVTRKGYTFDGWRVEDNPEADKIEKIAKGKDADVDVFASWKKDDYTITYVLDGGGVPGKPKSTYSETYSRSKKNVLPTNVTKDGAKFMGWYTEPKGEGYLYKEIAKSEDEIEDFTLYAHYESTLYKVTYMLKGGKLKGKILTASGSYIEIYDSKQKVTLYDAKDIIYDGGKFVRWEDEYGQVYDKFEKDHFGDMTLYAIYASETVEITFDIGEKGVLPGEVITNGKFKKTYSLVEDTKLPTNLSYSDVKKSRTPGVWYEEYYFAGWYTNKDCTGKPVTIISKGNPQNITKLYAKWEKNEYTIYYHLDGGVVRTLMSKDDMSQENVYINDEYTLPFGKTMQRSYHEFVGWYDNSSRTGSAITKLTARPKQLKNGEIHLYAKWNKTSYVLIYKVVTTVPGKYNDVHVNRTKQITINNSLPYVLDDKDSKDSLVPEFERDDIGFDGWYRRDEEENLVGDEIIYFDVNAKADEVVYGKIVNFADMSEEEKEAYYIRKEERAVKIADAKAKRETINKQNSSDEGEKTVNDMKPGGSSYDDMIVWYALNFKASGQGGKDNQESIINKLFGAVANAFEVLLGDGEDTEDEESPTEASPSIIPISIREFKSYTPITTKSLGLDTPDNTVLDRIVIISAKTAVGEEIDSLRGLTILEGADLSDIADAHPDSTIVVKAVFRDKRIDPTPVTPRYRGGSNNSGGNGKGGGAGGGRLPTGHSSIVVNPYGFDGRGNDNGALRAGILKLQINANYARKASPSFGEYKTMNLAKGSSGFFGLANETWEYFPASNEFKMYMSAANGDKYYLTNGWYEVVNNSQEIWYRFDKDGIMQRGFIEENGKVYYLNNNINELAYMATGFKDIEGTGYTGYFRKDGVLVALFPTGARAAYETELLPLPKEPSFDRVLYEKCKYVDRERNRILKTEKSYGQSAMGNFVGYWYYMASGQKKFRFETIGTELQIVRFAKDGWINIYDTDTKLHSYRFDTDANLIVSANTPEGFLVDSKGRLPGYNTLVDFAKIDVTKYTGYLLASTTLNTLPVNTRKLQSHLVALNGMPIPDSPATDMWTVIDLQGTVPLLLNSVFGGSSIHQQMQPFKILSNATNAVSTAVGLSETEETTPVIDAVAGIMNTVNIVKMTKVLSTFDFSKSIKTVKEIANERNMTSVYGICMDIYNTVKDLFAA